GADQVPHVELTREVARRFNNAFTPVFPEPDAKLTEIPKVPGTDGRKMSKSYGNAIYLSDPPDVIIRKVKPMVTDPARKRRSDPGNPDVCPVFDLHKIFTPAAEREACATGCRTAGIGCLDCKDVLLRHLVPRLDGIRERRQKFAERPGAAAGADDHRPVPGAPRGDRVPRPRGRRRVPGDGRDAHPPQVQAARAARSERDRGAGRGGRGASARARGAAARVRAREGPRHVVGDARGGASAPLESPGGRLATARGGPARGPVGPPARAGDAAPDRGAAPQDAPRDRAQPALDPRADDRDPHAAPRHVVAPVLVARRGRAPPLRGRGHLAPG